MQDPLIPLGVHRVVSHTGISAREFTVVYYFEGAPDTGLMRELITVYRRGKTLLPRNPDEMVTEVNWSALGSVSDGWQLERFTTALEDARKLKSAIDLGLVMCLIGNQEIPDRLVGADWWAL